MLNKKTGRNRNCNKGVKCQLYVKRRAKTGTERDQLNYGKHSQKSKEQPGPLMNFIIVSSTQTVKKGKTP